MLQRLAALSEEEDRILVLIQLNGGNDGLNTIIPIDQYANLSKARKNILIPENKVIKISDTLAFHPSMAAMKYYLFDEQKMCIVQDVGYPDPNYSHFRSTEIWESSSSSSQFVHSGWVGRYLSKKHPDYPDGYPNADNPDPLSITLGAVVSPTCQGLTVNMGMALLNLEYFHQLLSEGADQAPDSPFGHELTFLRRTIQQSNAYTNSIKEAAAKAKNLSNKYPEDNYLADQLKVVAHLIAGGLKTKIYVVNIGGFDTHSDQTDKSDPTKGVHAQLLKMLSEAVFAFQDDLRLMGLEDKVLSMTYSEFGRRVASNDSRGTDHGAAAPLMLFGTSVNPIVLGNNPKIPDKVTVEDNVYMQYDFRSVYASVLNYWLGVPSAAIKDLLFEDFEILPILNERITPIQEDWANSEMQLYQNFPNPVSSATKIKFRAKAGHTLLKVMDMYGREVSVLMDSTISAGEHEVVFHAQGLAAGIYTYVLQQGRGKLSKQMFVIR
ncbi:MAG: hypothetical protein OHK0038_08420 [Flammeovirgaceae bacterium]